MSVMQALLMFIGGGAAGALLGGYGLFVFLRNKANEINDLLGAHKSEPTTGEVNTPETPQPVLRVVDPARAEEPQPVQRVKAPAPR